MTYAETNEFFDQTSGTSGNSVGIFSNVIRRLKKAGQRDNVVYVGLHSAPQQTPREKCLNEIQRTVSFASMHLLEGFSEGLNRQFANMLDDDAWETSDQLPTVEAVDTFLQVLYFSQANRRPGIGSNGRGSITAFWKSGDNRLTVTCLPKDWATWVLTRVFGPNNIERVAGECTPQRLKEVLGPYNPEIWFDS